MGGIGLEAPGRLLVAPSLFFLVVTVFGLVTALKPAEVDRLTVFLLISVDVDWVSPNVSFTSCAGRLMEGLLGTLEGILWKDLSMAVRLMLRLTLDETEV